MANLQSETYAPLDNFIKQAGFPCVGAKIAQNKDQIEIHEFGDIESGDNDISILHKLYHFISRFNQQKRLYFSFVCVFEQSSLDSEIGFEKAMWNRLQALHDIDREEYPWDKRVSSDPDDGEFSYSLGREAFFIIGLNPHAERKAREFKHPAIVFNLHSQFQALKDANKFDGLRDRIRKDEELFSGSVNPNLHDHGVVSEAGQYSGRMVGKQWQCPFLSRSHNE